MTYQQESRLPQGLYLLIANILVLALVDMPGESRSKSAGDELLYFTTLSYWTMAFYFTAAAFHTFEYARTGHTFLENEKNRIAQHMHILLYTTITVFAFVVGVVYWTFLSGSTTGTANETFDRWSNCSRHVLNMVFAGLELVVSRHALDWVTALIHLFCLCCFLLLYLAVVRINFVRTGAVPYGFLDPYQHGSAYIVAHCAIIFVITVASLLLVSLFMWFRNVVTEGALGLTGKFKIVKREDEEKGIDLRIDEIPFPPQPGGGVRQTGAGQTVG